MTAEERTIYILIDSDGEPICAFVDEDQARKEAQDCGCSILPIRLIEKQPITLD